MSQSTDKPLPSVGMYSFTSPDPQRLASFWGQLMGLPITDDGSGAVVFLDLDHEVTPHTWIIEHGDGLAPAVNNRVALDIGIDDDADWATVADRAEKLGATRDTEHEESGVRWIVMQDPDGNRFRVFAPRPA